MAIVGVWTGRYASKLRMALRLTNEAFAERLGTAVRTVAKWNSDPDLVPMPELQRALDTLLETANEQAKARFSWLIQDDAADREGSGNLDAAELRLANDPVITQVLSWLDNLAGWPTGSARRLVAGLLQQIDSRQVHDRADLRSAVGREQIANALAAFYGRRPDGYAPYRAKCDGIEVTTSILTRREWLDLRLPLGTGRDHTALDPNAAQAQFTMPEVAARAAAMRVATALATDTRIVNSVLYRLLSINVEDGRMEAEVGLTDFVTYALTLDLLENELIDAIADKRSPTLRNLPLRALYLPTADSVVALSDRLCAGGPLALFAAARPRRRRGGAADYMLLVQERSGRVLNAARRLAVIPKSFHEPLVDFSDDAQISATLDREMEEELFGRTDVDSTLGGQLLADPLHLSRLSEPMRWLVEHTDDNRWAMECTGFGLNLVSGNFECASLIVIHDDEWWTRFGGRVEANWESDRLHSYSTLDARSVGRLVHDASWSNEGLFAFLQGLRRLSEIGGQRVNLPTIDWEL